MICSAMSKQGIQNIVKISSNTAVKYEAIEIWKKIIVARVFNGI